MNGSGLNKPPCSSRTGYNSVVPYAFHDRTPVSEGSPEPAPVELFGADEVKSIPVRVITHAIEN